MKYIQKILDDSKFRIDIQGLRAIAVTLVLLDHAFRWPKGGFIGVDVFYVISGYLISSHIMREIRTTGSLSFTKFYARRARRIFPVAIFVSIITVIFSFIIWFPPRAAQTILDSISAILFVSNFHFMALGADYLQQNSSISPLQQYWSLSIEEQFYAVWPLTLVVLTWFTKSNRLLISAFILFIILSLSWGILVTLSNPAAAYFDTGARAWELLSGAVIALTGTAAVCPRISDRLRRGLSAAGVALIIISALIISSAWPVPVPAVAPAIIGAMAVIWADAAVGSRSLLGNGVSQWLGKISYSLYLWHFPVLIFAFSQFGGSFKVALSVIPIIFLLSWLSYIYIERAVLEGTFLRKVIDQPTGKKWKPSSDLAFGLLALSCITVFALAQLYGPAAVRSAWPWLKFLPDRSYAVAATPASSEISKANDIREALAAEKWPLNIVSQLSVLSDADFAEAMTACRQSVNSDKPPKICHYNYGATNVAVIGDSIAASWAPAIESVARERGWNLNVISYSNCSLFDVAVSDKSGSEKFVTDCNNRRDELFRYINELNPEFLFISASESAMTYTGLNIEEAASEWEAGSVRTFRKLAGIRHIVVLENPPWGADPVECATRYSSPGKCVQDVSIRHKLKSNAEYMAAKKFDHVVYIPTRAWFCADDRCPVFSSDIVTRVDKAHLTSNESASLWKLIDNRLKKAIGPEK